MLRLGRREVDRPLLLPPQLRAMRHEGHRY
jgi:hypothetical protein